MCFSTIVKEHLLEFVGEFYRFRQRLRQEEQQDCFGRSHEPSHPREQLVAKKWRPTPSPESMELIVNSLHAVQKGRTTMYARVITTQYQPGKMEEGLQIYREALSETRQQPGFKEVLGLVDRRTDKAMSIVLWETEADAQASGTGSAYFQAQMAKLVPLFAGTPIIEMYEVAVQE